MSSTAIEELQIMHFIRVDLVAQMQTVRRLHDQVLYRFHSTFSSNRSHAEQITEKWLARKLTTPLLSVFRKTSG